MFKNLLIKLANKIINKYNIHYLNEDSYIHMYNERFKIIEITLNKSEIYSTSVNIRGIDVFEYLKNSIKSK
jgi:hypothetical protein